MKKRLISLLLCLVLCMSLLPMAALAEDIEPLAVEEGEAMPEPTAEPEPTVEPEPTAEPEPTETPEPTAEPEPDPAAQVQALLDALPDAETVTADTRAAVEAQLTAIDDARLALDDDSMLDYTRYAAVVAALEALDGTPGASEPETLATTVNDATALNNAVASGGEITLGKDITLTSSLDIKKVVTLNLNGKTLTFSGVAPAFKITSGGTLNLNDTGGGKIVITNATIGQSSAGIAQVKEGATFNMRGGTLTGCANSAQWAAGGVRVGGTFNMSGGTITGCSNSVSYSGGGVYVTTGGVFNLSGGTITNCSTSAQNSGGGVYAVNGATVNISGSGTITNCSTSASYSGGGVHYKTSKTYSTTGSLTMSGGTISNCISTGSSNSAGGVHVYDGGTFTMTGGTISGCSSTGGKSAGGVLVSHDSSFTIEENSVFTMSGGTILGCSSTGGSSAGGVYVGDNGEFNMSGNTNTTKIESCTTTAGGSAGGVCVGSGGEFTMSGGRLYLCGAKTGDWDDTKASKYSAAGGVYVASNGTFTMKNANITACYFQIQSTDNEYAPRNACAGGVVNNGNFTIDGNSLIDQSQVYMRSILVGDSNGSLYMYTKGLANTGTVHANDGKIDGIYNVGTVCCDEGEDGTHFSVLDAVVNGVIESARPYAKHYNENNGTNDIGETCNGTISGGVFKGAVHNYGVIYGGTFESANGSTSSVMNGCLIAGGTFDGKVENLIYHSQIDGGIFTGTVDNSNYGIVRGGTFTGAARTKVCQISFDLDGGTGTTPATQWRWNAAATAPEGADPTKRGYKFLGWYNGDTRFDFTSNVTSATDITLKAKWLELPEAAVTAPTAKTGLEYNGSAQTLINAGSSTNGTMKYSLAQNGTYTTELPTATNAETYTVWFYAEGDGTTTSDSDKKSVSVTIAPKSIQNADIQLSSPTYNGGEQSPAVTVTDTAPHKALVKNTDYTIAAGSSGTGVSGATSATNVGNYNLVVKGQGNYTGSVTRTWSIQPKSITPQSLTAKNKIYNGNTDAEIENVSFHDLAPGETLTMGTDYTVSNAKFVDANAGDNKTVTATVTLNNTARAKNYKLASNAVNGTASITKKSITAVITVADKQYDGKTAASVSAALNTSDLISGDSITITGLTGTFAGVQVGSGISVAVDSSGVVISGAENYNVTIPATASGAIVNGWHPAKNTEYTATEPNENGWLKDSLTITAGLGYELSLTNTADGTWSSTLTGSTEGADSKLEFYVRNVTTGAISEKATENYKLDKNTEASETTGTIQFVGRQSWQEFVSHITFGLFYKDEVTVQATAEDKLSGVDTIEYAASDKALTLAQVESISDWMDMPTGGVGVTLEDAKKFVYFLRITDKAGNTTYLSTDGAEYDTAPPVISGIENGASYHTTRSVTVSDRNLLSVTLNGETATLEDGKLRLTGDVDAVYTIRATDKAGNATEYTVTMKKISALTDPVKDITVDNATSQDRGNIDSVLDGIDNELENEDMTDAEKRTLNDERDLLEDALERLDDAKAATEDKSITDTDDIDKDNAKSTDKQKLEDAKDAIEKALEDYGGNLTDAEKQSLNDKLDRIEDALERLDDAKAATEDKSITDTDDIDKDNAKSSDKQKLEDAKDAIEKTLEDYDANLTDAEKQSLNDKLDRIEDALAAIEAAEKAAKAVRTGDEALPILWLALSLSAALALGYTARRKKN